MSTPISPADVSAQGVDLDVPWGPVPEASGVLRELQAELERRQRFIDPNTVHDFARAPFIFTRVKEKNEGFFIYAALNPQEASFTFALREELEKCGGGEVLHTFPASPERESDLGRFISEIRAEFTLTAGNCLPVRVLLNESGEEELRIPAGLKTFYDLKALILEADRIMEDGRSNDFIVTMNTVPFPLVTLTGKIDPAGISYTLSANEPNTVSGIRFSLSVHKSVPRLVDAGDLNSAWDLVAKSGGIGPRGL